MYKCNVTVNKCKNHSCRDGMHRAKNRGNKEILLAILSRILAAQSCVTLYLNYVGRGYA